MMNPVRLTILLASVMLWPSTTAAQTSTAPPTTAATPASVPLSSVAGVTALRSTSPVVSIALRYEGGSAADATGLEGRARVAAEAAAAALADALDGPRVDFHVAPDATTFVVTALPSEWTRALQTAVRSLDAAPPVEYVRTALDAHAERIEFEKGAPLAEFQERFDRLLAGGDAPWARPVDGSFASVTALDPAAMLAQVRFAEPMLAVVGPVSGREVAAALGGWVVTPGGSAVAADGSQTPVDMGRNAAAGEQAGPTGLWGVEARETIVGAVMNRWTAAAFPAPPDVPRTHLEFLAHILDERLDPYPPADGVYDLETGVRDLPAGRVLLVIGTFRHDVGGGWEDRFAAAVAELAAAAPPSPFFETFLKRFRARALLAESGPQDEARRLVDELARGEVPRALEDEIQALTPAAVTSAASRLGPPRMLQFGPPAGR